MAEVVQVIANSATTTLPNLVPLAIQSVRPVIMWPTPHAWGRAMDPNPRYSSGTPQSSVQLSRCAARCDRPHQPHPWSRAAGELNSSTL